MNKKADKKTIERELIMIGSCEILLNVNAGGGQLNHFARSNRIIYRFVEDGIMVYEDAGYNLCEIAEAILEQEYDYYVKFEEVEELDVYKISKNEMLYCIQILSKKQ